MAGSIVKESEGDRPTTGQEGSAEEASNQLPLPVPGNTSRTEGIESLISTETDSNRSTLTRVAHYPLQNSLGAFPGNPITGNASSVPLASAFARETPMEHPTYPPQNLNFHSIGSDYVASAGLDESLRQAARWIPSQQQQLRAQAQTSTAPTGIDTSSQSAALTHLNLVISALAEHEKTDYLTALESAPGLVQTESDPRRFLRFYKNDPKAAALGLVRFWKRRREVFGDDAFLPLTITGDGALTSDDIACVKDGHYLVLPEDDHGRTVICYDPSKRLKCSPEVRLRATFYFGFVISENEKSQMEGFVSLSFIRDDTYDLESNDCIELILNTFPNKLKSVHMIDSRADGSLSKEFSEGLLDNYRDLFLKYQTYIHPSHNKREIIRQLLSHGLTTAGLPSSIGGRWGDNEFVGWQLARILSDEKRSSFLKGRTVTSSIAPSLSPKITSAPPKEHKDAKLKADAELDTKPRALEVQPVDWSRKPPENLTAAEEKVKAKLAELPRTATGCYYEALQKVPARVWEEEAGIDKFLRVEGFDDKATAARIARYWQIRCRTFGAKAFASIYQTGEDALDRKDLFALGSGFLKLLPDDAQGCPVLFADTSSLRSSSPDECRDRCFFYLFSLLSENVMSQKEGAVLIYNLEPDPFSLVNLSFLETLNHCMPMKFKDVHLLSNQIPSVDVHSKIQFGKRTHLHVSPSKNSLRAALEAFGMTSEGLPCYVNGSWGYEMFVQWQELRTRMEFRIPVGLSGRDGATALDFPAVRAYAILPDDEKTERKRRLNVIHSRRKRDRERIERGVLRGHISQLKEEQVKLKQDNLLLTDLSRAARSIVQQLHEGQAESLVYNPALLGHQTQSWQSVASNAHLMLVQGLRPDIWQQQQVHYQQQQQVRDQQQQQQQLYHQQQQQQQQQLYHQHQQQQQQQQQQLLYQNLPLHPTIILGGHSTYPVLGTSTSMPEFSTLGGQDEGMNHAQNSSMPLQSRYGRMQTTTTSREQRQQELQATFGEHPNNSPTSLS